jgi:hypothetical protein
LSSSFRQNYRFAQRASHPADQDMRRLLADPGEIDCVPTSGALHARATAAPVMDEVVGRVGLVQ